MGREVENVLVRQYLSGPWVQMLRHAFANTSKDQQDRDDDRRNVPMGITYAC